MNNNENINWREIVTGFSSYEGTWEISAMQIILLKVNFITIKRNLRMKITIYSFMQFQ